MKVILHKVLLFLLLIALFLSTGIVIADNSLPPEISLVQTEQKDHQFSLEASESLTRSTGGPDEFGYTYDDTETYNWIDADTLGEDLGLTVAYGGAISDAVEIGFSFPFYENIYSQIFITTHGWVTFESLPEDFSSFNENWNFITPSIPNNLIAAYWETFNYQNESAIYTYQGGSEPNRFFVVEWHEVFNYAVGPYTFQLVLHENGEIVMQYHTIPDPNTAQLYGIIGIEDSRGWDGLQYVFTDYTIPQETAVMFSPPDPARRVFLSPLYQGSLADHTSHDYELALINTGTLGTDIFTLTMDTTWPISIFEADGETEITDSISLAQGETKSIIVRVTTPPGAEIADQNTAQITLSSSDPTKSKTATIFSTIPTRFAQVFVADPKSSPSFYFITPEIQTITTIYDTLYATSFSMALQELPNGNFLFVWERYGVITNNLGIDIYGTMIWYTILDRDGNIILPRTMLSKMEDVTIDYADEFPSDTIPYLSMAPNGNVSVVWKRKLRNNQYEIINNIYLSIINIDGDIVLEEQNITQLEEAYAFGEVGYTDFEEFRVAATSDGRFTPVWIKVTHTEVYNQRDIEFTIINHSGETISEVQNLNIGTYSSVNYLSVTPMKDNQIFIAGVKQNPNSTYYTVIDSSANTVKEAVNITEEIWWVPVSTQLTDGTIVLVGSGNDYHVKYVMIDETTLEPDLPFTTLPNPPDMPWVWYPSVTSDIAGNAVLTWRGGTGDISTSSSKNTHLIYALVSKDGIITAPTYAHTPHDQSSDVYDMFTSEKGQSITTYHEFFPPFFTSVPQTAATQGSFYSYAIIVDDYDLAYGDNLTISSKNPLPAWLSLTDHLNGTATLFGTPDNNDVGALEVELIATDNGGLTDSQTFTITISNVNDPPFFDSVPITTAKEGQLYEYAITADDPDLIHGDSITIEATTLPTWLSLTDHGTGSASLSGTPGSGDGGANNVVLIVTDLSEETDQQSFTIDVSTGVAPLFTSDSLATFSVGLSGTVTITAIGNPVPDITLDESQSDPLPDGLVFTPGTGTATLSGTPAIGTGGNFNLVFIANNGINPPAQQSFTLTVNEALKFTSANTITFTVELPAEFEITATGFPSPEIILDAASDPIPNGLVFSPGTTSATLSGTPAQGSGGVYHLMFIASNGSLPNATQAFTLIIETVKQIDDQGGAISSNDDTILIDVPPGAISDEVIFTLVPQTEPTETSGSLAFAGISFTLSAEEVLSGDPVTTFDPPLVIKIYYNEEDLDGIDEEGLTLLYWDPDLETWLDALCPDGEYERNLDENWFTLPICHLTEFAVFGSGGYQVFLPLIRR